MLEFRSLLGRDTALCLVDTEPRSLTTSQIQVLKMLTAIVSDNLAIHKQMIETKEMFSDAKTQAKERALLFSSINHELRTPLHLIIGFAEMIEGELLGSIGNS